MTGALDGDLSRVRLPADLELLRDAAQAGLDQGHDLGALYAALAAQAPMALLDLAMGPKALSGTAAVTAALDVLPQLSQAASPMAVYRRLGDLAPELRPALLQSAAAAHPLAKWVVKLSQDHDPVGAVHLAACHDHPGYAEVCARYARAGHLPALVGECRAGRPEALAALLAADATDAALDGAGALLEAHPTVRVVPWVFAACGPRAAQSFLHRLVPRLRSAQAAQGLRADLGPHPATQRLLDLVLRGMRPQT
jgi:hypothetical protein